MLSQLRSDVQKEANFEKAKLLQRFFKTGKGEYAEEDVFLGLTVPQSRKIVAKYKDLPLSDVTKLLKSKFHEERLIALLIMVYQFEKGTEEQQKKIHDIYLKHTKYINNWDLVDLSAANIVGEYLKDKDRSVLYELARSEYLWEKRISMIATFAFICKDEYDSTFQIADILLNGVTASNAASATQSVASHDLIQKAVGWMLREVGKRISEQAEEEFLRTRYKTMPRTMLRYAIERFPEEKRKKYLRGII